LPFINCAASGAFHLFPILLPPACERSRFMEEMKRRGIQTSVHYPPVHRFHYYQKHFQQDAGTLPLTEEVSRREVTLPLHPLMKPEDVDFVCQAISEIISA
jgi:dTDP-4-amino-4,6-dideoxygalactose transaminase